MDHEALARRDRDALIELIPRQQALIERLTARVTELGAVMAWQSGPPRTAGNSSVSPSAGFKGNRAERWARRRARALAWC